MGSRDKRKPDGEKTGTSHAVDLVRERAQALYDGDDQSVSHRMDHIELVLTNSQAIAVHFPDAHTELLTLAVLLHDVTSPFDRKEQHVKLSMNTARRILNGIGYPHERTDKVLEIIAQHSIENLKSGELSSV